MISRFYLQDYLSFKEIELEFDKGLVVFTGPSGAGKSILMGAILSLFGNSDALAKVSEVCCENLAVANEDYAIQSNDEFVIKQTNNNKVRFLLNNQTISKKALKEFGQIFSKHLHLKDTTDFHSHKVIEFLDFLVKQKDTIFPELLNTYQEDFKQLKQLNDKLSKVKKDEEQLEELISFTKFEIEKIASINPQVDEFEELKVIKNNLSKKEKIQEALEKCEPFMSNTHHISKALDLLDVDSSFFDDCMNELNNIFEKFEDSLMSMQGMDIENVLDRIEQLSSLQKRFGSIEQALEYKKSKEVELEEYENISFEKAILEKNIKKLEQKVQDLSLQISQKRQEFLPTLKEIVDEYLQYLYLDNFKIKLVSKHSDINGCDEVELTLAGVVLDKISSGEFNRLRLAFLTARSKYECKDGGILFLDEIDANLSGKESESIAKVLQELSLYYQIFSISHQPQLSATAHQHFLVEKIDGVSTVRKLDKQDRINEISRMISGENITKEAIDFANILLR